MTNRKMFNLLIFIQLVILGCSLQSFANDSTIVRFGDVNVVAGESVSDVVVLFGDLTVEGNIEKDAVVIFGDLHVGKGGKISNDAVVIGGNLSFVSPHQIGGDQVNVALSGKKTGDLFAGVFKLAMVVAILKYFGVLASKLFFLVISILLAFIFAKPLMAIGETLSSAPWKCGLVGLLAWLCLPAMALLMVLTIIGIFLIPLVVPFLFIIVIFSFASMAALIGQQIKLKSASPAMQITLGAFIIFFLSLIPFAFYFVFLVTVLMGTGAILFSKFGTKKPKFLS